MSTHIDDLVNGLTSLNIDAAVQHAAILSTTKVERTLGPDKPLWSEMKSEISKKSAPAPDVKARTVKLRTKRTETLEDLAMPESNFPDILDINRRTVEREMAQLCKRNVEDQLKALERIRQQQMEIKRKSLGEERSNEERKQHQEKQLHIQQKAEQLAAKELELQNNELNALRKHNELKLKEASFEGIVRYQAKFRAKYERVIKRMLDAHRDDQKACGDFNRELSTLVKMFDQFISKIKTGTCGATELNAAEQFCHSLDELDENIQKELKKLSQQAAQKLKADEDNKAKELAEQKQRAVQAQQEKQRQQQVEAEAQAAAALQKQAEAAATAAAAAAAAEAAKQSQAPVQAVGLSATPQPPVANTTAPTAGPGISSVYVHPTRMAFYNEINQLYQAKVDSVKPLQTDDAWKKYRNNCQRVINMPLNAISAVSSQHLTLNFEKLYNFFAGQRVKTMDGGTITINDHPLARDYCMLLMAKKFVSQSETAISSNPQAAFPFASVVVTFWKVLPDFGKIFLAYVYKESPYLVPYIMPQEPGQTPEQYLKSIGYRMSEHNELEKPDMYLKRQSGLARLYAAVTITPGRRSDGPMHPFGIWEAWRWLVHVVHVKPLPDICATLIMEILQTSGFELRRVYGRQFLKLILYIQQYYIPQLTAYDQGGPKTRLEMLLAKVLRERQVPQVVGVLQPGFW